MQAREKEANENLKKMGHMRQNIRQYRIDEQIWKRTERELGEQIDELRAEIPPLESEIKRQKTRNAKLDQAMA